jgi:protein-tyrosine-phosphatase
VTSAGLTTDDSPAAEPAAQVAADLGFDLSGHRSRVLSVPMVESSDLVIGLAREHVREAVLLVPDAFGRTFTLKELVRRGGELGGRAPGETLEAWLARVHEGRTKLLHLGASADDDVEDPIGRRPAVFERVGDELVALVDQLVELAWPADEPVPPPGSTELATT